MGVIRIVAGGCGGTVGGDMGGRGMYGGGGSHYYNNLVLISHLS